jgi:hypothetical protein
MNQENNKYFGAVISIARHGKVGMQAAIGFADAEHSR